MTSEKSVIKSCTYVKVGKIYMFEGPLGFRTTEMDRHVEKMLADGWQIVNSSTDAGHVKLGNTVAAAAITGGLSLLFGASREKTKVTLMFNK